MLDRRHQDDNFLPSPYFDVVVWLVWSYEPESYANGSVATVGSPMPNRSEIMAKTERDTLVLEVGEFALIVEKLLMIAVGQRNH
jgi:hypothetical protein